MASLNLVILLGNVGKDPTVRYLDNNSKVAQASLATTKYYTGRDGQKKELTEWHNLVFFGNTATVVENYVHKGSQISVVGSLRTREYEQNGQRKWTTEVVVDNLQLCGSRADIQAAGMINGARQLAESQNRGGGNNYQSQQARPAAQSATQPQPSQQAAPATIFEAPDDDLPF